MSERFQPKTVKSLRMRVVDAIAPVIVFIVLSVGLTYPLALNLGTHLRDNGDSYEYAWVIGFGAYQLIHDPLHLYDGNIFYPYPLSLAYSDSTVPNIVLGAPIVWLTDNPVLALNIMILLTYVLGGYGMYLFVQQRTGSAGAGLVAGILYAFTPYRYEHLAQLPNVSMEWAPFALWSFERYLGSGRYRWAAGFALFSVLQVLVSFYYAFILGVGIFLHVVVAVVRSWRVIARPRWLLPWLGFSALGALATVPFVKPYFDVERAFGLSRSLSEAAAFSAWPGNFIAATPVMRVILIYPVIKTLLHLDPFGPALAASERHLYPGTLIVVLAAVAVITRRSGKIIAPIAMVVVGVLLSFGPYLHLQPDVVQPLPFSMPYAILFTYLPGFAALRVPSRFDALVILGLAILAGDGLVALQSWLSQRPAHSLFPWERVRVRSRTRWLGDALRPSPSPSPSPPGRGKSVVTRAAFSPLALTVVCAAIGIAEGINTFPLAPVRVGADVPPVYRWLASSPASGAVLELPIDDNAYHESPRAYYSTYDHRPLVDGFRSFLPPTYNDLASVLRTFPSTKAVSTLDRLGVRFVVVHRAELDARQRELIDASQLPPGVQIATTLGEDVVYRVTSGLPPDGARLVEATPSCPPRPSASADLSVELLSGSGLPITVVRPDTRELAFSLDWVGPGGATHRDLSYVPIAAAVLASPAQLTVPFRAPNDPSLRLARVSVDTGGVSATANVVDAWPTVANRSELADTPMRLMDGVLLNTRVAGVGPTYRLAWQQLAKPPGQLVVFVNAYDGHDRYWSFPSGKEDRFPRAASCPNGAILESDQLLIQPNTPPGQYWVEAGLMDPSTKQRVPFISPTGDRVTRVVLGSFWVYPPDVYAPATQAPPDGPAHSFGDRITLQDAAVDGNLTPGGKLNVQLRWEDQRTMSTDYTIFVHVADQSGKILAQYDGQPAAGKYPTSAWQPGETVIDHLSAPLPGAIPPGSYEVQVGLYDVKTGQRLSVSGPDGKPIGDHLTIATFQR